jgi:hypothetical protein
MQSHALCLLKFAAETSRLLMHARKYIPAGVALQLLRPGWILATANNGIIIHSCWYEAKLAIKQVCLSSVAH